MALPVHVLERLPGGLRKNGLVSTADQLLARDQLLSPEPERLSWADVLLGGAWPEGMVSELALAGGLSGGTTLGLWACRHAQQQGSQGPRFCAFIDPAQTLHAPGVQQAGVLLSHLLVVRPLVEDISRVSLRLAESQKIALLVIDLTGSPSFPLDVQLGNWVRVIRRLNQAVAHSPLRVLLLTPREAHRPVPLPVALRIEVSRPQPQELFFAVKKSPDGRLGEGHKLPFRTGPALASTQGGDKPFSAARRPHVA